jgi:predicted glycoside hydrolase/deacetylase ChbG (UPF0249 family)
MSTLRHESGTRSIAVCVDDFGLHKGVNRAALDLGEKGRISSITCLVDGHAWPAGAHALKHSTANVEIGLHLNFTEDFGQNRFFRKLSRLIVSAHARRLDRAAITHEIERQLDRFESDLDRAPDFIDGHQHVHQLPIIREALIEVLNGRSTIGKPWIRSTRPPQAQAARRLPYAIRIKSRLIAWLGAASLERLAQRHGYPQNRHLLGVYGFGANPPYADLLKIWLTGAQSRDVLMCHPALPGPWQDPLGEARAREYQALSDPALAEWIVSAGIEITPLRKEIS